LSFTSPPLVWQWMQSRLQRFVISYTGWFGNPMHPIPIAPAATGNDLKECFTNQLPHLFHPVRFEKKAIDASCLATIPGGQNILFMPNL
jgi:hypothetical protein